jgi:hypothetical protein
LCIQKGAFNDYDQWERWADPEVHTHTYIYLEEHWGLTLISKLIKSNYCEKTFSHVFFGCMSAEYYLWYGRFYWRWKYQKEFETTYQESQQVIVKSSFQWSSIQQVKILCTIFFLCHNIEGENSNLNCFKGLFRLAYLFVLICWHKHLRNCFGELAETAYDMSISWFSLFP